jgi:hypothetical protein
MLKARDLKRGDVFMLQLRGEVVEAGPVADGKRISIKLALIDSPSLEFAYDGSVIEFLAKPGRPFQICHHRGGRRGGGSSAPDPAPPPLEEVTP